jgi:hypothetical protein
VSAPAQQPWSLWSKDATFIKQKTGLDREIVDEIYTMCENHLKQHPIHTHDNNDTMTQISPRNMLVLTLYWFREYPSLQSMSLDFNIPITTLFAMFDRVIDILNDIIVPAYIHPLSPTDPQSQYPLFRNTCLIIDSTFIPIPIPGDREERKRYHHIKSPTRHALKVEISCSMNNLIVNVSDAVPGSTADITIARTSGVLQQLGVNQQGIGDKGCIGEKQIKTPLRINMKQKQNENLAPHVTRQTVHMERDLHHQRASIENINYRVKLWKLMKQIYRGNIHDTVKASKIVKIICALCNRDMYVHPIRASK